MILALSQGLFAVGSVFEVTAVMGTPSSVDCSQSIIENMNLKLSPCPLNMATCS